MATKAIENDSGRSLREIVQKKILDDVVGVSGGYNIFYQYIYLFL